MGQSSAKPFGYGTPGVIYSEDWKAPEVEDFSAWKGTLFHVRPDQLPNVMKKSIDNDDPAKKPGPEEIPYTFWERIGAVPLSAARLRPRQYYHPVTDFTKFSYDQMSPEEVELRSRWMARMWEFGWQYPLILWSAGTAFCIPLPFKIRLPATVVVGISVVMLEFHRVYVNASKEKEMLDDFLFAKEIWYIKNVETKEFGLDTLPPGVSGIQAVQERWAEEERLASLDATAVRGGLSGGKSVAPTFQGQGLEDAYGRTKDNQGSGGIHMGDIGIPRPGQQQGQRGLMRINEEKRLPNIPL
jgi:hypothetical protein